MERIRNRRAQERTNARLELRMSAAEKEQLRINAHNNGVTMSAYVVERCAQPDELPFIQSRLQLAMIGDHMMHFWRVLSGIGTNINQIAHRVNITQELGADGANGLRAALESFDEIMPDMRRAAQELRRQL